MSEYISSPGSKQCEDIGELNDQMVVFSLSERSAEQEQETLPSAPVDDIKLDYTGNWFGQWRKDMMGIKEGREILTTRAEIERRREWQEGVL